MNKANIKTGMTLQHCNYGTVRVLEVKTRGVMVAATTGREGYKVTNEYTVTAADLQE